MEIGAIAAIRPVPAIKLSSSAPDLAGVFAVEFRHQDKDDTFSPSHKPSRGLEDENAEEDNIAADTEAPETNISIFA